MTIDEKALEAVKVAMSQIHNPWLEKGMRAIITAYLAALPPTGDAGELVREAREQYFAEPDRSFVNRLADALTAAEARIAELEREASRAEIYRAVLESAGYQNIDTIKDVMNAKALGAVVACCFIGLQNNLASATSRAERLEAALVKLGPTDGWAAMIAELQGWTASEFLSGEGGNTKDQVECYSFMCRLIGWLMVAQDAAALSPAPSEGGDDE